MSNNDLMTKVNEQLAYLYSNGKGELGLEVGVDAGLDQENYVMIPKSMKKAWAAKINIEEYNKQYKPLAKVPKWNSESNVKDFVNVNGWVTSGQMRILNGKKEVLHNTPDGMKWFEITEFHMDPMTYVDMLNFVTVNTGHINDEEYDIKDQKWIHATRFWSVAGGFVVTSKNIEYKIVDDPVKPIDDKEGFVEYISKYSANAWTAAAARTTSWKKTNHCTGGTPAAGLPRRWLMKEEHWSSANDNNTRKQQEIRATSGFYLATHAVSVHSVLAQLVPEDKHHWVIMDPSFGFITKWEIGESIKVRMIPKEAVAGAAMVTDAVVVLKMLVAEGLSPCLEHKDQAPYLIDAYKEVQQKGMACAVYRNWFFEGYPLKVESTGFNQRDPKFFNLVSELAIIAMRFYAGSTIAASPTLSNVARQSTFESIKSNWSAAASTRHELTTNDLLKVIEVVRGVSGANVVSRLLSRSATEQVSAVVDFNAQLRDLGKLLGIDNTKQLDIQSLPPVGLIDSPNL